MNTKNLIFSFIIALFCFTSTFSCNSCRHTLSSPKIRVNDSPVSGDNFSTSSLKRFISDAENRGASVVVRDPSINRDGVSMNPINSRVCALIEMGLMKKEYNPRDRRLFENAVAKLEDGSDYPKIREVTGTDLIFEVTKFNAIEYEVSNFESRNVPITIQKSKKEVIRPTYILIGFSIEIKVILLADNLIAGIFKYNKVPCTNGCEVTNFDEINLTYIDPDLRKTVVAKSITSQGNISFDKYDKEISDFISDFVIPAMFNEMEGKSLQNYNMLRYNTAIVPEKMIPETNLPENNEENSKEANTEKSNLNIKKPLSLAERLLIVEEQKALKEEETRKQKALEEEERIKQKALEEEKNRRIALTSSNSYEMASSISNLIFDAIKDSKKSGKYRNDEERFGNLKDRTQIMNYVTSITNIVASFPEKNSNKIVFYFKKEEGREMALLLFLDGKCIGAGTKNKGLLTKLPIAQFTGIHTISLWNTEKELLNMPVDFTFKTYYPFEWNRNTVSLAKVSTNNQSNRESVVAASVNSYEISNSVSDLILKCITGQEPKKHGRYKTDEERFDKLNDKKQIMDYISSVTTNVASPKEDNRTAVFFCESAKGNDLTVLLFLDGRCIGIGSKNKGFLAQIPESSGIHTFSLWCNDKKMLSIPVNFSFKSYYQFEWKRNSISMKN